MNSIEFVGPSGIGKTTFLKELLNHKGKNSLWCTGQEILQEINYKKYSLFERALIKGGKYCGARIKGNRNGNYVEKITKHKISCAPVIDVFLSFLNANSELESWQKVRLFDYYIKTTLYEKLVIYEANPQQTILFDEGIVVNGGIREVLENPKFEKITESPIFPNAVIFLDLDLPIYRERILSRFRDKGEKRINPLIPHISEGEINDYIVMVKKISHKKLEACKLLNIPVLEIKPIPTHENFQKVLAFIEKVSCKK